MEQVRGLIKRDNKKQRIIVAGEDLDKKSRPCKNKNGALPPSIQKPNKLVQMRYPLAGSSIIRDLYDNSIIAYYMSRDMTVKLVLNTINKAMKKKMSPQNCNSIVTKAHNMSQTNILR